MEVEMTTAPAETSSKEESSEGKKGDEESEKMEVEVERPEAGLEVNEGAVDEVDEEAVEKEVGEEEGEDEDDDEDDELEEDDDDDEAEAIARRLGDQLWADIQRARAGTVAASSTAPAAVAPSTPASTSPNNTPSKAFTSRNAKEEAALATMRIVLSCTEQDAPVLARMAATNLTAHEKPSSTTSPSNDSSSSTLHALLTSCVSTARIPPELAGPLSQALLALAKSEDLFSPHALGLSAASVATADATVGTKRKASGEVQVGGAKRLAAELPSV